MTCQPPCQLSPKTLTKAQRKKLNKKKRRNNNHNNNSDDDCRNEIKVTIINSNYSPDANFASLLSTPTVSNLSLSSSFSSLSSSSSSLSSSSSSYSYKPKSFFKKLSKFDDTVSY